MSTFHDDLAAVALRSVPRVYGTSTLPGFVAVLAKTTRLGALVLTHDMDHVSCQDLTWDELLSRFEPDLTRTPLSVVEQLESCAGTFFSPDTKQTGERLAALKEILMKKAKPVTVRSLKQAAAKPGRVVKVPSVETGSAGLGGKHARWQPRVVADHNRRTAIEVSRVDGIVVYIPLDVQGYDTVTADATDFDRAYQPLEGYPVERAARLYVGYAQHTGATPAAIKELSRLTTITTQEKTVMVAKQAAKLKKIDVAPKAADQPKAGKTPAKTAAKKAGSQPKALKQAREASGPTAATRFRELIMEGKLTDDQLFAKVQKEFGLGDEKRSYVAWYRNDLRKKGQKPPEPKAAR